MPVDNQMNLIRHRSELRIFVNSPELMKWEVCLCNRLFFTNPFKIPVHRQLANP